MLIAHVSSSCDVCLDTYSENCSYHTIPCGHVFCLPCLVSTTPAKCPLCRHEFSPYTMRKLHLTLPSPRDFTARKLEMKLVQSSPEMTLAESLTLFQEVQDWLEGEPQDEFLVLRAFAAVLCGFHETKDKLLQNQTEAEQTEATLRRSLDEARKVSESDVADYKTRYKAAKSELVALRLECAELRAAEQQRTIDLQAQYTQVQAQAQLQVAESQSATRRISNPLPMPPRPVDIPLLKLIEARASVSHAKGKGKEPTVDVDPINSAFVPTLSSVTTRQHRSGAGTSEITTLVFKPPKRMPVWDHPDTSYAPTKPSAQASSDKDSSSGPSSYTGTSDKAQVEITPVDQAAPYRLSNPTSKPDSYTGGWADRLPMPPAHESSGPTSRPRVHKHPTFAGVSRPLSYVGWPEPQDPPVPVVPDHPTITAQRTALQDGSGMASRRASSPVVAYTRPHALDGLISATHHGGASGDQGRSNGRPVAARSYMMSTTGNDPATSKEYHSAQRRRTSQSPSKPRRPDVSEYRSGTLAHEAPPGTSDDDAPRMPKPSQHGPRPSHDLSHSLSTHAPLTQSRIPSPVPTRERAPTHLYSYPGPPFASRTQYTHDDHINETSRSRHANPLYMMDTNGPPFVLPMAEV